MGKVMRLTIQEKSELAYDLHGETTDVCGLLKLALETEDSGRVKFIETALKQARRAAESALKLWLDASVDAPGYTLPKFDDKTKPTT
jgi:hypothetical protein